MNRLRFVSIVLHLLVAINAALGLWCVGLLVMELKSLLVSLRHDWSELLMLPLLLVLVALAGVFFVPPWHVWRDGRTPAYLRLTCCLPIVAGVVFLLPKTMALETWLEGRFDQERELMRTLEGLAGWALVFLAGVIYFPLAGWIVSAHSRGDQYPLAQRRTGVKLYATLHAVAAFFAMSPAGTVLHESLRTQPGDGNLLWHAVGALGPLIGAVLLYKGAVWLLLWPHRPTENEKASELHTPVT